MPTYPVKNLKTGETKEIVMSMKQYDQWRKDNPDWDKRVQVELSVQLEMYTVKQMVDGMKFSQELGQCPVQK